jgi:DNA-binding NtrC family response regulator
MMDALLPLRTLVLIGDPDALAPVSALFDHQGWRVWSARSGSEGIELYEQERADLALLCATVGDESGTAVLEELRRRQPDATVIMLSRANDRLSAVDALRAGAEYLITAPWQDDHLLAVVQRTYEKAELRRLNRSLAHRQVQQSSLATLGSSPAMRELAHNLQLLAAGNAPILLTGETGSGKGWAAKLIHAASPRHNGPFVSVNCAGLSSTFLDSELFGHEKGAFTDAKALKPGLLEVANGGTLILDEIGDLAPELQPKLLTVLETQRFRRLGGTREIQVDVRLIAATHVNLEDAVKAGRFRQDLYYRLAVLPLRIPSLRERGSAEIADIAIRLLGDLRRFLGRGPTSISPAALDLIVSYPWPGNVRELRNVLERSLLLAGDATQLEPEHLPIEAKRFVSPEEPLGEDLSLAAAERRHIERVLAHAEGNRARAAKLLRMSRQTLYTRLREFGDRES